VATKPVRIEREESFFQRMAIGLALFILFGFAQFAARGIVDYRQVPLIVHAHAAAMTTWLGLLVLQSVLAQRMDISMHRALGLASLGLVVAIPPLAIATCVTMLRLHAVPPFFAPAFFLVLVTIESLTFAGLIIAAVLLRKQRDWHMRLIIGAAVILMEPALGRLLPMPLLGAWGEWLAMAVQLAAVAIVARRDIAMHGALHRATLVIGGAVIATHVVDTLLAEVPVVIRITQSIAG